MPRQTIDSPTGPLTLTDTAGRLTGVSWGGERWSDDSPLLRRAAAQLSAYFAGTPTSFDLPLAVAGSDFQRAVCDAMTAIPFGKTVTYGDIAGQLGQPAQAVGQACGANPLPIVIPCHRVLAARSLGGYSGAGGIETKVWLLRHEGAAGLLI